MGSGLVIVVLVGIGIAVQVAVLGRTARETDPLAVAFALQISGVAVAAVWATTKGTWGDVLAIGRYWWWIPLGAGGWVVVAALGFAAERIGVAATVSVSVATQVLTAFAIDSSTGSGHVGARSVLGAALVLGGVIVVGPAA